MVTTPIASTWDLRKRPTWWVVWQLATPTPDAHHFPTLPILARRSSMAELPVPTVTSRLVPLLSPAAAAFRPTLHSVLVKHRLLGHLHRLRLHLRPFPAPLRALWLARPAHPPLVPRLPLQFLTRPLHKHGLVRWPSALVAYQIQRIRMEPMWTRRAPLIKSIVGSRTQP